MTKPYKELQGDLYKRISVQRANRALRETYKTMLVVWAVASSIVLFNWLFMKEPGVNYLHSFLLVTTTCVVVPYAVFLFLRHVVKYWG